MAYNSQYTGAQIDEAIGDVRDNKEAWGKRNFRPSPPPTTVNSCGWSMERGARKQFLARMEVVSDGN